MKLAGPVHLYRLQPVEVGPTCLHIGIGELVGCTDDVAFGGDEVRDGDRTPSLRFGAPDGEAQHVHFAGRLPLQEHGLALRGGGEGDQSDGGPGQGVQHQQQQQQEGQQTQEGPEEHRPPDEPPADGPVEGPVRDGDNPSLPLHSDGFPDQRLRGPGRVGGGHGVPPGEHQPLRGAAQEAMEEGPAAVLKEHHVAGAEFIRARQFHPHHVAGAKGGVHTHSPHPDPQRARPAVADGVYPMDVGWRHF